MIDVKKLKENKLFYSKSFKNKGLNLDKEIDNVISIYDEYHSFLLKEQKLRFELNQISASIKNNPHLKDKAKEISSNAKEISLKVNELKEEIMLIISTFPNPSFEEVPIGKNENDNVIISSYFDENMENKFSIPHWEIIENKKLVLQEEASFISGTRQVIYNDKAALVIKALEKFMIDNAIEDDYIVIEPPVLINKESLFNTGQLPKFEDDLFKVGDQFLIPTGEVPLTNLVANKIFKNNELPKKFVAGTNCFRKEAGSAGKDTRGLIRLHQFRKVELVKIGRQEDLNNDFDSMLKTSMNVLNKLKLPYRLLQLCTGDSSFTSAKTIDIEVWMPGVNMYREISSVSVCSDFQSRRMKTKYIDENGNKKLVYTYNGSALAIGRTFAAILENNIQDNGMIKVPDALKPYLTFEEF